MEQSIRIAYKDWISNPIFDSDTKAELMAIADDEKAIEDRFYKSLQFGTGGLRGIIGAGQNRMNIYTVGRATQGLAQCINKCDSQMNGVVIAYDSRNMSYEFASTAAKVLNANNIRTWMFDSLRPTPELSFAVRELECIAGIVITASHNPSEYNGYKVYWSDGAQITDEIASGITAEIDTIDDYGKINGLGTSVSDDMMNTIIGNNIDDKYISALKRLVINPEILNNIGPQLKIVYSPLHGAGYSLVPRILSELGFTNVWIVPEQSIPDGAFPTVKYPNPEDKAAFKLALELAEQVDADIVLATDPDADRLGIYAKDYLTGEYVMFTGNMLGILIAAYELECKKSKNCLTSDDVIVTTVVSSKMAKAIADDYNVGTIETLTGFKYIGEQIKYFDRDRLCNGYSPNFLFGFEESYGCLTGTFARDKDAVCAVMCLCEAAAYYRSKGISLCQQMQNLYEKYGYYEEQLISVTLPGKEGGEIISTYMTATRNNPPNEIAGISVVSVTDYMDCNIRYYEVQKKAKRVFAQNPPVEMPKSNVLYFELADNSWVCVRPSGTEPKIKFYIGVMGDSVMECRYKIENLSASFKDIF